MLTSINLQCCNIKTLW